MCRMLLYLIQKNLCDMIQIRYHNLCLVTKGDKAVFNAVLYEPKLKTMHTKFKELYITKQLPKHLIKFGHYCLLTLLLSERPKLCTILAFLSAIGLSSSNWRQS